MTGTTSRFGMRGRSLVDIPGFDELSTVSPTPSGTRSAASRESDVLRAERAAAEDATYRLREKRLQYDQWHSKFREKRQEADSMASQVEEQERQLNVYAAQRIEVIKKVRAEREEWEGKRAAADAEYDALSQQTVGVRAKNAEVSARVAELQPYADCLARAVGQTVFREVASLLERYGVLTYYRDEFHADFQKALEEVDDRQRRLAAALAAHQTSRYRAELRFVEERAEAREEVKRMVAQRAAAVDGVMRLTEKQSEYAATISALRDLVRRAGVGRATSLEQMVMLLEHRWVDLVEILNDKDAIPRGLSQTEKRARLLKMTGGRQVARGFVCAGSPLGRCSQRGSPSRVCLHLESGGTPGESRGDIEERAGEMEPEPEGNVGAAGSEVVGE